LNSGKAKSVRKIEKTLYFRPKEKKEENLCNQKRKANPFKGGTRAKILEKNHLLHQEGNQRDLKRKHLLQKEPGGKRGKEKSRPKTWTLRRENKEAQS